MMSMKVIMIVSLFSFLCFGDLFSQSKQPYQSIFGKNFESVFNNTASGNYAGTANGILFFKNPQNKDVILDFQGSPLTLVLEEDIDEVYDVSRKIYTAYTTSGKTKITYTTYATANRLTIQYQGQEFAIGIIDGACDMAIDGLNWKYLNEKDTEYLILTVNKELYLSNYHFLLEQIGYKDDLIEKEVVNKEMLIGLQAGTAIVFAINR